MPELTDDQLDGLFRKSDEEFDPPFDPAAWQAMQSRLDEHDRTKPAPVFMGKKPLRWGLFIGLLLLLGVGWYAYHYKRSTETGAGLIANQKASTPATEPPTGKPHPRAQLQPTNPLTLETAKGPSPATLSPQEQASRPAGRVARASDAEPPSNGIPNPGEQANFSEPDKLANPSGPVAASKRKADRERAGHLSPSAPVLARTAMTVNPYRKTVRPFKEENLQLDKRGVTADYADPANPPVSTSSTFSDHRRRFKATSAPIAQLVDRETAEPVVGVSEPATAQPVIIQPALAELANRPLHWPDSLTLVTPSIIARPDTAKRSVGQMAYQRGLSIRLAVSPDLSGIGLTNFSRPGTNVGVLLEYRLAPRWSFQAGILRSVKVYTASATKYEWAGMDWPVHPESVGGRCNMLDIPINVRYDFALRPRPGRQFPSRWFVSGGVTSYYMLREDYTYKYANPKDPAIIYRTWPIENGTGGYEFSQLNVSVGYERGFTRRLSWQVEPFLKVPLKEVGYYKLDLLSTGAFFSLRYKL